MLGKGCWCLVRVVVNAYRWLRIGLACMRSLMLVGLAFTGMRPYLCVHWFVRLSSEYMI